MTWRDTTLGNLDSLIKEYGVKYIFVVSGKEGIEEKLKEEGPEEYTDACFWVELSWGGPGDYYDFAYNNFGSTLGEAIGNCLDMFQEDVWNKMHPQIEAADEFGVYERLVK